MNFFRQSFVLSIALTFFYSLIAQGNLKVRKIASEELPYESLATESPNEWRADRAIYSIGFESTSSTLGFVPLGAASFSKWWSPSWGFDVFFGYTKSTDSYTQTTTQSDNNLTLSRTLVVSNSGTKNAHNFMLGGMLKHRFYQNSWLQIYGGLVALLQPAFSVSYPTGSQTNTYADSTNLNTYSVSQASLGTVTRASTLTMGFGPKVGAEIYLKWFPHLALGFATGIYTALVGEQSVTTSTRTQTYAVTNGVAAAPSADSSSNSTVVTPGQLTGTTFGIGGYYFQFTGVFTIRYAW